MRGCVCVIEYREEERQLSLACDQCAQRATLDRLDTLFQALEEATHQGWAVKTECGDLCPTCAHAWVLESIDKALQDD